MRFNMQSLLILSTLLALAYAVPFEILEDSDGQQFYLVPINRQRRDTTVDVSKQPNGGTVVSVGHEGMIDLGNSNNKLTVGGFATKQYDPKGPTTLGGTVGFENKIAGTKVSATVAKTPVYGTDVSVQAQKTLFKEGGATLKATAGANQHFGGLPGTSKADPNVGLEFKYVPRMKNHDTNLCRLLGSIRPNCRYPCNC